MSSYKYKSGFKSLLPPIILKESNNLNINIENLIPMQSKCPNGKNCPNYKIILELKQEIFKLIDKISQLKKLAEYSIPNPGKSKKVKRERNINTEKESENKDDNICNQLINSFRNSSKNKFLKLKNISNSQFSFRYNLLRYDKIRERPNSAKISELKESFQKVLNKDKNKIKDKKEKGKEKEKEKESQKENEKGEEEIKDGKEKDKQNGKENNKENELNNINVINRKLNVNYFTLSSRKKNDSSHRNKKYINNLRYNVDDSGNISLTKNARLNKESFSYLGRTRFNDLSSLNLHLSNSIISPAIKVTPKNLFDSIKASEENKKTNKENEECVNIF
jgi:hypothetical protein